MTRTGVMASSRPRKDSAKAATGTYSGLARRLSIVSAALLLMLAVALPSVALAETKEATSGYSSPPNKPTTTEKSGTSPSKESSSPTSTATSPATTTSTEPAKSTLPFTGFDLRWSVLIGVLLIGAGFSIVTVQRRQRSDS